MIHSVDSGALALKLDEAARDAGRTLKLLIQVDLAGESTKHGARPDEVPGILAAAGGCRFARISGLMLLPPAVSEPAAARPYFKALVQLRDDLVAARNRQGLAHRPFDGHEP